MKKVFSLTFILSLALLSCEQNGGGGGGGGTITLNGEYKYCTQTHPPTDERRVVAEYCAVFSFTEDLKGSTIIIANTLTPFTYSFDGAKIKILEIEVGKHLLDDEFVLSEDRKTITWTSIVEGQVTGQVELKFVGLAQDY